MCVRIAGVDCAVDPSKTGLALAEWSAGRCRVIEARAGSRNDTPLEILSRWHAEAPLGLLTLDAPLGWPEVFSRQLASHRAGESIPAGPGEFFRRETDCDIHRRFAKMPLEVGANFIARTALAALRLLGDLRDRTGEMIPLAWGASPPERFSAIEVYPAATLRGAGMSVFPYKKKGDAGNREVMLAEFPKWLAISPPVLAAACRDADVLDAILCVVAGVDYCEGRAVGPPAEWEDVARIEGWIWAAPAG